MLEAKNKYFYIQFIGILFFATILRLIFINNTNYMYDYNKYLINWINFIKENNGIAALGKDIPTCNYTPAYITFLVIISYFNIEPYILIKLFSIFFDILCMIIIFKIVYKLTNNVNKALISIVILSVSFSLVIISSFWGQCDSIYLFFILYSIYFILKKKYTVSMLLYGVAFSLKLQTIFIAPFFLYLLIKKKIKIKDIFIAITPYIAFMIIPLLYGRSLIDLLLIYIKQPSSNGEIKFLTHSRVHLFSGIATIFDGNISVNNILKNISIVITLLLITFVLCFLLKENKMSNLITIEYLFIISFFISASLPLLQSRYSIIPEILALILILSKSSISGYCILYYILSQLQYLTEYSPLQVENEIIFLSFFYVINFLTIVVFINLTNKYFFTKQIKTPC